MPARNSITIATAGHVDHGKTSLVRQITGINTDTLAEEKSRGLSINLGFAYHHITQDKDGNPVDYTIGFVDVPGHTDFINNALAGISVVDSALLIIAADDGIMPQTREHLAILDLLGIDSGAVVLTKIDRSSEERIDQVKRDIAELLSGSCLQDVPLFPVSSVSGVGIPALVDYLQQSLFNSTVTEVADHRKFRFVIDRCFTLKGIGTVVTGTVKSGTVITGQNLILSRAGSIIRVKGLRHDQQSIESASAGERVAININLPHQQVSRGDWLMDPELHHGVTRFDARLRLLKPMVFKSSAEYHLYHGAAHHLVKLRPLPEENPSFYQITSSDPVFALHGDCFLLRDPASTRTIGGGEVIDIFVPRRGRASPERIEVLQALDQEDFKALQSLLESQDSGVNLENFALARNCNPDRITSFLDQLTTQKVPFVILNLNDKSHQLLLHSKYYQSFADLILKYLAEYHRANSSKLGVSEPALSKSISFKNSHLL
ncbi:MAG: selenocysteine-specific translation elongation factor, partial [Gammaproteobacteria bacterium]|nr:selenocysteine-specific translation elongation factor [Gammaproteobacteria bacterium]